MSAPRRFRRFPRGHNEDRAVRVPADRRVRRRPAPSPVMHATPSGDAPPSLRFKRPCKFRKTTSPSMSFDSRETIAGKSSNTSRRACPSITTSHSRMSGASEARSRVPPTILSSAAAYSGNPSHETASDKFRQTCPDAIVTFSDVIRPAGFTVNADAVHLRHHRRRRVASLFAAGGERDGRVAERPLSNVTEARAARTSLALSMIERRASTACCSVWGG